jgi:hypothetical protein
MSSELIDTVSTGYKLPASKYYFDCPDEVNVHRQCPIMAHCSMYITLCSKSYILLKNLFGDLIYSQRNPLDVCVLSTSQRV